MSDIIKTQHSLALKAAHNPTHQFGHLYRLICQEEWIRTALNLVLANKGARTAGIDGLTKRAWATPTAQAKLVRELQEELRSGTFRPVPVRRIYIPKANGQTRPLGIATLKDRVVQMLLKMILEPIWESDFLDCSHGFRPQRRTIDCVAGIRGFINRRNKYYWAIEGDIKAAFDRIHHERLLNLLAKRIDDRRLLNLVASFLKAGIMEENCFQPTSIGVPQGAICSPLLANIYLHQLDVYWWKNYGSLTKTEKERRRKQHKGNCVFIRYADDWLLLTNGSKREAYRLREEFRTFLREELKLELSVEKTHVTHIDDGLDFLGFHIRRHVSNNRPPVVLITPSAKAQKRLKAKIKAMTARAQVKDSPLLKLSAVNSVLRGWINYYRHCNAKRTAHKLDFWVNERMMRWLQKRHHLPIRRILAMYKHRENGKRFNCGVPNGEGEMYLYRMSDQAITKYYRRTLRNPYISGSTNTKIEVAEVYLAEGSWEGNATDNGKWRELKARVKAERGAQCERCGRTGELDLHHLKARSEGGQDTKANVELLCEACHVQTPTYGARRREQGGKAV